MEEDSFFTLGAKNLLIRCYEKAFKDRQEGDAYVQNLIEAIEVSKEFLYGEGSLKDPFKREEVMQYAKSAYKVLLKDSKENKISLPKGFSENKIKEEIRKLNSELNTVYDEEPGEDDPLAYRRKIINTQNTSRITYLDQLILVLDNEKKKADKIILCFTKNGAAYSTKAYIFFKGKSIGEIEYQKSLTSRDVEAEFLMQKNRYQDLEVVLVKDDRNGPERNIGLQPAY